MKAVLKKVHKGKVAATIVQTFSDVPALFEFLLKQGVHVSFKDCVSDIQLPEVTYTVPLTNVEADNGYN